MRILFLTHRLPYTPNRGDRIRAYHILKCLSRTHEVHLVSLIHDAAEVEHLTDLKDTVAPVTGVGISRSRNLLAAALARPLTHVLLHSPRMGPILRKCVRSAPPDLVLAYCTGMARYAMEPPLTAFPCVLDMVDVDSEKWFALADASAGPTRWIYRREASSLRDFERRASATLVVNERERVLLERIVPGSNAIVVQNGVEVAAFAPIAGPQADPRLVFCGVFDYGPNESGAVWMASEVWPLVTRAIPEAQLTLVGMNPSRAVRALATNPSIRVTGAVSDVRPYLWGAAVAIAPIWVARGLQNKVLEAIAAGLPCVVTPGVLEGLPLSVRPACLVGHDAGSFADAILSLLRESPNERRRIAGRPNLAQLTWGAQLVPLLDALAGVPQNRVSCA